MKIRTMIFVALLAMSGQASSDYYLTGSELLTSCETTNIVNQAACVAYLMGIVDATETYQEWGEAETYQEWREAIEREQFCIPVTVVDGRQLMKIFIKYANDNPKDLHHGAPSVAANAFIGAFPCK